MPVPFKLLRLHESAPAREAKSLHCDLTTSNTLATLEPVQYYYVLLSQPCELAIPQSQS
jgi:hypothetical protein